MTSANFTSIGEAAGEALGKAIAVKVSGQTYPANITANTDALKKAVNDTLSKIENKERKIKFDKSSIKEFKDELTKALTEQIKVTLLPNVTQEALQKAAEGKVMKVEIAPLLTNLRKALKDATTASPLQAEVGIQEAKLRNIVQNVLNKQGFMLTISTVNDNYSKVVQQKLNGTRYTVKIHADAKEITQSVQASLMQVQSRTFGLQVAKDVLRRSIDEALMGKPFPIQIAVMPDQARRAVQNALNNARMVGKDDALAYQRLQTGELRAAQAELARLKAAHMGAADSARAHASASISLGGALGSNIKIAGELGSAMASLYSVHALKEFLSQVIEIGGELEHQKIAMDTIFGDKGKTSELFGQIKGLARQSPFGVMELTKSVKALSAYGVQYNEIYDTAKRLADISAATSVDINRLILAFGKTKSRGFLDGLEAKQFAYANIPIYEMVRKKLEELEGQAITTADVMARIKKREIGFDIVKDVLWDMTDEGGKFYNMQEALAGSVKTSWKLVRDNIELMFGEIAESSVGGALKGIAEILQALTRNWKTLGISIGVSAAALGIYKVAMAASNAMMEKNTLTSMKNLSARRMVISANATAAMTYRDLTKAESIKLNTARGLHKIEGLRILSRTQLTEKEVRAMLSSKALTREELLKLVALKKVSVATAEKTLITKTSTAADAAATKQAIADAAATKKRIVMWNQFKAALAGVGSVLKSAFFTALPMVAIGGAVALWQRNNAEMEKAKEIGDNLFTKATEGADNLKKTLADIKPSAGLSNHELLQGIEQMEQAIKDYSPTPIEDINNALVAQDGHVRTLIEQHTILHDRVEELAKAHKGMDDTWMGDTVGKAIMATDGGNWFTQMFDDDIATNAKDYTDALGRVTDRISKYSREYANNMKNAVIAAMNADVKFRKAVSGMDSYEEKLRFLAENAKDYYNAATAFDLDMDRRDNGEQLSHFSNASQIKAAREELIKDTDKFIADMNGRMRQMSINPFLMTKEQKTQLAIALQSMLKQMDGAGEDAKALMAQKMEEVWGMAGMIMEDKIGPSMQEKFRTLVGQSTDECVKSAVRKLQYEGYTALSDAEKKLVDDLMNKAKAQTMSELGILNDKMQAYLTAHPLSQLITLSYASDAPSGLAKELVKKHGYPGLTDSTNRYVTSWTKSNSVYDARNAAQSALQAAKNELDAAKKAEVGVGAAQKKWNEVWAAIEYLGWSDLKTKDQKSNKEPKGKTSQKDKFAESLKQRFKDIKDAWGEFQKWSKTEGREAAATRIGESGLFSTLSADKIPQTVEQYRALVVELENELRQAGVKGTARESLLNELLRQLLDIDKTVVDEQLKLALDEVNKEADRQLANFNLFKDLEKATGNRQFAMDFAFGIGVDGPTDYESLIKDKFNAVAKAYKSTLTYDSATPELLADAPPEVRKAWEEAYKEIQKYRDNERKEVADMVEQYRSTQEEIIAITEEAEEKKRKIRESNTLDSVTKQQMSDKIDADLNYEVFRKSGEYLKFFNAILSMTGKEAEDVGRKIKEALDEELKAGQISAKDYCDEMEKIDAQLEKIRQKQKGFGGFGSFAQGGLQQMFKDRYDQAQSDHKAATEDYDKAKQQFDLYSKKGNEAGMQQAQSAMDSAKAMQEGAGSAMQGAQGAMSTMAVIDMIVHGINDTVQGIKGAFELIKDMADSYGVDTSADTDWGAASAFLGAFSEASQYATDAWDSLKSGNVGGVIQGVVGSITSWFTAFNKWHDEKLQEQIERSKEVVQNIQYAYDLIERRMENHLGNKRNLEIFDVDQAKRDIASLDKEIAGYEAKRDKLNGKRDDGWKAGVGIAAGAGAVAGPIGAIVGSTVGSIVAGVMTFVNKSSINKINKKLNSLYEERERIVARIAAYEEGGALGLQRQMMTEQLAELEKQRQAELDKKKTDDSVVKDLDDQIDELTVKIRDFGIEMAKEIYGIDLNSWAEQFGDALVDAFAAGEDAAEAFDKTASDIMRSLVGKMLTQDLIAPMFEDVRDYLFGDNGVYTKGATGGDFELSEAEAIGLAERLNKMRGVVDDAKVIYDSINEATGGMLDDMESKSGLSAGIQGVTEDTADLLASYLNAIRADVALQTGSYWTQLLDDSLPQINIIAQSQLDMQRQIAENTLRNAVAAEAIQVSTYKLVELNDQMGRSWRRIAERTWGYS
ncbi:MAG: hypothetical protein K2I45_04675 [Muribaculaceae bacterium]|nr:hypothetical protein [Muribaculaceae bacterium]